MKKRILNLGAGVQSTAIFNTERAVQKMIYLAGPINGCSDSEAKDWREHLKLQFVCCDPMKRDYRGKEKSNYREIVELDKRDILSCNLMVVMYTKPSVGTSMEVLFAWMNGIPVLTINDSRSELSPWLTYHSTCVVETLGEAISKLKEWK